MADEPCIRVARSGDSTLVALFGEIDIAAESAFERTLPVVARWARPVLIDLAGATFFSAAGVAFLVRLANALGRDNVTIIRSCPTADLVLQVCELELPREEAGGGQPPGGPAFAHA